MGPRSWPASSWHSSTGLAFRFPVWVNRCGVMAGAGQFGRADQGIFTFWIHSWLHRRPLQYIGFDGEGRQVRDCLDPRDLGELIEQLSAGSDTFRSRVVNVGGGVKSARSARATERVVSRPPRPHEGQSVLETRTFDVPWMVLDASAASTAWNGCRRQPPTRFATRFSRTRNCTLGGSPSRANLIAVIAVADQMLPPLTRLSVVIPARDEAGCIASTVEHLHVELRIHSVPHEIVVVDDGSTDGTWQVLQSLRARISELVPLQSEAPHGFGRAVVHGLAHLTGDAVVVMMADESDDCRDVVRYWQMLNDGWECVFGSRFVAGGGTIDYPRLKLA